MSIYRSVVVVCDRCGRKSDTGLNSFSDARGWARDREGWVTVKIGRRDLDYCHILSAQIRAEDANAGSGHSV